ncbi:MAG: DUF4912 domain-containing protein [Clostridia bacterium]
MATTKTTKSKKVAVSKVKSTQEVPNKKTTTPKEILPKKETATRKTTNTNKRTNKKSVSNIIEYYDLPNRYNKTIVNLLFQTPKKLFVYWEISEDDRQKFLEENGKDFFEKSIPYLIVKNETKNYSFEIEINDFANSWYFDIPDSDCKYSVELIRKVKENNFSVPITSSKQLEVPNNHILFEQNRKEIFFKNVKTNNVISKSVVNLQFINHLGNVRNANSFYKKFYDEKDLRTINNPSSN